MKFMKLSQTDEIIYNLLKIDKKYKTNKAVYKRCYLRLLIIRLIKWWGVEKALKLLQRKIQGANYSSFLKRLTVVKEVKEYFNIILKRYNTENFDFVLYHLSDSINKCPICSKYTINKYCSKICANQIERRKITPEEYAERTLKIKQTLLEKYGDENYVNVKKCKKTKLERYGDENYNNTEKFKESRKYTDNAAAEIKRKKTKLERYGDETFNNSSKRQETMLERYGKEFYSQTEEFKESVSLLNKFKYNKEKIQNTNLEKYGVVSYSQTEEFKEKYKETSLNKYGTDHHFKTREFREKAKEFYFEKYGVDHHAQIHINNIEHLNEQFLRDNFIKDGYFLKEECKKYFNIGSGFILSKKREFNIVEPNKTEKHKTQNFIYNNINTENKILNDRSLIEPLEIDILLPDHKLAIEYNGLMFHSRGISEHTMFNTPNQPKTRHLEKTELVESRGFKLFHIFESDNLDIWLSMINNHLGLNKKIYARKTQLKKLKQHEVKDFLEQNHLQGSCTSSINYGLFYEQELVEVMTFGQPRFNKNYEFELIRLCTKKYTNVVGGASKLFARFLKDYPTGNIISYANRRFSNGKIYEKLGFNFIRKSEPNYFYFMPNIFELYSRNKFQKHKLKEFDNYSSDKSESQIMFENGFRQIFDSGNLVYEYKRDLVYSMDSFGLIN